MATYLDELVQKITTRADLKGFDDLDRKQRRAIKSNDLLAQSFRRAFGIFFGIQGVRSVIQTTRDLDLLKSSIEGLTKSTQDWEYLRKEADRTGTSFKTVAGAYKNFYSSANMAGFNKNQIQEMFSDVLTAGRGAGISQQQMGGALLAMEQMLSRSRVSMQELRQQLGNAMPGAFELAAKAMGVTTKQLNELVEKGLDAKVLLPRLTKEMKNYYLEAYYKNKHTLDAEIWRLDNAWMEFQANILQGDAGEALAQLVRDVTKILRSQKLLKFVEKIGKGLNFIFKTLSFIFRHLKLLAILTAVNYAILKMGNVIKIIIGVLPTLIGFIQTLALGFTMLISGQVIEGLAVLKNALWALNVPLLALLRNIALISIGLLVIVDLIESLQGKDTVTRTIAQDASKQAKAVDTKTGNYKASTTVVPFAPVPVTTPVQFNPNDNRTFKQKVKDFFKFTPPDPETVRRIQEPSHYINTSNSQSGNANISYNPTYNINGSNLNPEVIAAIVDEHNMKFFQNYQMGFMPA